jgi:hypothetical protein
LIDNPPKKMPVQVCQASAAGSNTASNINTGLEAGSHADFIALYIGHPALTGLNTNNLLIAEPLTLTNI